MVSVRSPASLVLPDHGRSDPSTGGSGSAEHAPAVVDGNEDVAEHLRTLRRSGTFVWIDPEAGVVCAALTTREFGEWAKDTWPRFADAVLDELG